MINVDMTKAAERELDKMKGKAYHQVKGCIESLKKWPNVSGVEAMQGNRKGEYRKRTGDYRVIFEFSTRTIKEGKAGIEKKETFIIVTSAGDRKEIYR